MIIFTRHGLCFTKYYIYQNICKGGDEGRSYLKMGKWLLIEGRKSKIKIMAGREK